MSYIEKYIEKHDISTKNGKVVNSSERALNFESAYKKYRDQHPGGEELYGARLFREKLKEHAPDITPEKKEYTYPTASVDSEVELVALCFKDLGITINATGEEILKDSNPIQYASLENLVAKFVVDYNNQSQFMTDEGKMMKLRRTFADGDVKKVIAGQIVLTDLDNRKNLREKLAFKGEKHANYVKAKLTEIYTLMKPENEKDWDVDFHVLMTMQWMWQVKQHQYPKMSGTNFIKTVKDYYFINFSSPSGLGAGKTTFVRKLCEGLEDYSYDATLQNAANSSDHGMFASNYIVFFDELSFGSIPASDRGKIITVFKWLLTAEKMFQRIFHKQSFQKMRRMFSGIGTSNGSLTDVIYDPTGMRRFYEITVSATRNVKRYKAINNMVSEKMWQGIDENDREGFIITDSAEFKKLQAIQAGYVKRDAIDIYLDAQREDDNTQQLIMMGDKRVSDLMKRFEEMPHNSKQSEIESALNISLSTIQEIRTSMLDFYDADNSEQRFLPKRDSLARQLRLKGYWVLKHNNADLVALEEGEETTTTATSLPDEA